MWNPDLPATEDFRAQWQVVPDNEEFDNGFKAQWELFLRHVVEDAPYSRGTSGPARAGCSSPSSACESAREGRRVEVPELDL